MRIIPKTFLLLMLDTFLLAGDPQEAIHRYFLEIGVPKN